MALKSGMVVAHRFLDDQTTCALLVSVQSLLGHERGHTLVVDSGGGPGGEFGCKPHQNTFHWTQAASVHSF